MSARRHSAPARKRDVRVAKASNAREAVGVLTPGAEIYILTYGQFALLDAIVEILHQTGPARVVVATWTAANADLSRMEQQLSTNAGLITDLRWIVDRSFATRQPAYCAKMRELFGDQCIRTTRTHAKFVTIRNDHWSLAIRTSANLNENPRMESLEISDDDALCSFLENVADDLFDEQPPGVLNGDLPLLAHAPDTHRRPVVAMGVAKVGR